MATPNTSLWSQTARIAHTVTLAMPHDMSRGHQEDYIRSISRTVQVDAKGTVQVPLLQPDYPGMAGEGLKVIVDGREEKDGVRVAMAQGGRQGAYRDGYRGRGGRYYSTKSKGMAEESQPLVLVSPRVNIDKFRFDNPDKPGIALEGAPGRVSSAMFGAGLVMAAAEGPVRALEPVENWSPRWLSYSRYDGVVLMREDLERLERGTADSQAVRAALLQYVEAGGSLLLLGGDGETEEPTSRLPAGWKRNQETRHGVQISYCGFGVCLQISNQNASQWGQARWNEVTKSWEQTANPLRGDRNLAEANNSLPIVDDVSLPVRGLFVLMLLFTIAIGPINVWLLARWKRRIWLLWTVPVISAVTCLAVFGYMIVAEGWQGRTRVTGFTLLDEKEQRATTLGARRATLP